MIADKTKNEVAVILQETKIQLEWETGYRFSRGTKLVADTLTVGVRKSD